MTFDISTLLKINSGIYVISNSIDDRIYIGSAVNFWRRYRDHRYKLLNNIHANKYLQSFVNKYGIQSLSFKLIVLCKNTCLLFNEKHYIDTLKPQFNIKPIIQRPYFPDTDAYFFKKERDDWWEFMMPGSVKQAEDYIKKYPSIEGLDFIQHIEYYEGNYPSCPFPKQAEVDVAPKNKVQRNCMAKRPSNISPSKRKEILKWARS